MPILARAVIALVSVSSLSVCAPAARAQAAQAVSAAQPQVKDDLFAGAEKFAEGAVDVTDINLSPDMLSMLGGTAMADLARKTKFVVVHSYRYPKPGMYKMEDVEPFRKKLQSGEWKCIVHDVETDTGETSDICVRPARDHTGNELAMVVVEPQELTFIDISGTVALSDLQKLDSLGRPAKSSTTSRQPQAK